MPPQPKKTHPKKPRVPKVTRTSRSKPKKQHEMTQTTTAKKSFDLPSLPSDLKMNILSRVVAIENLWGVREVCSDWHEICKEPYMWRVIYMDCKLWSNCRPYLCPSGLPGYSPEAEIKAREMCKKAVKRSQGQLVDITMVSFCDDELLSYIAARSPKLRRLEIAYSESSLINLSEALKKFPKLEELSIHSAFKLQVDEAMGSYCPELKTLRLNHCCDIIRDKEIKDICENLRELRHFEIVNNHLSNTGLQAILDGCPCLKVLDLRLCQNVDLKGDIERRLEQIECVLHTERVNLDPYSDSGHFMDLKDL